MYNDDVIDVSNVCNNKLSVRLRVYLYYFPYQMGGPWPLVAVRNVRPTAAVGLTFLMASKAKYSLVISLFHMQQNVIGN